MKQKKNLPATFGLYAILTAPVLGYEKLTRLLVDHDVAFIQLRMKDSPPEEVLETARMMRKLTEGSRSRFIVNDLPEIAAEVDADGVHIGQNDMSYEEVRDIVGPEAIVGISTHNPDQTREACAVRPDYIGIGPVFPTPTKKNPDPVIGIQGMQKMLSVATVPAVVLGGIDLTNLSLVLQSGASNFSMVRQLTHSLQPEHVLAETARIAGNIR